MNEYIPCYNKYIMTRFCNLQEKTIDGNNTYEFNNILGEGIYYVIADDGGGCTGKSETCIIKTSPSFSFGLSKYSSLLSFSSFSSLIFNIFSL